MWKDEPGCSPQGGSGVELPGGGYVVVGVSFVPRQDTCSPCLGSRGGVSGVSEKKFGDFGWWRETKEMVDAAYVRFWDRRGGPPVTPDFSYGTKRRTLRGEPLPGEEPESPDDKHSTRGHG